MAEICIRLSPARTRSAFGPGRAVMILGPIKFELTWRTCKIGRWAFVGDWLQADFSPKARIERGGWET